LYFSVYSSYVDHCSINNNNNNPSRQSQRSRYNNQDYQTYTPPSIIRSTTIERRPRSYSDINLARDTYSSRRVEMPREISSKSVENRRKSFSDVNKTTINRRQSFQVGTRYAKNSGLILRFFIGEIAITVNPNDRQWSTSVSYV